MKLGELLTRQEEQMKTLLDLLRREQDLLVSEDVDGLQLHQLAASKRQPLDQIAALEDKRAAMQSSLGFGEDRAATARFAATCGCHEKWCAIQELARQAAYLNRLNGSVIQFRLNHTQRVLDDLWRIGGKPLYSADGLTRLTAGTLQSRA